MVRFKKPKSLLILALAAMLLLSTVLSGCSSSTAFASLEMHPVNQLPEHIQQAPERVREAYRFAVANPDLLKEVTCYCGCSPDVHDSNYECYVADIEEDGEMIYENHGLYCGTCVDITQDVMRLTAEGEAVEDIRLTIDELYSKYAPPVMAPIE